MELQKYVVRVTHPNPRFIEIMAIITAVVVIAAGALTICLMPHADFTRDKIISVLSVAISALGVATLLFLWAQLRHTATQDKLVAYHWHFRDFPRAAKVNAIYASMGRLEIPRPTWRKPLNVPDLAKITGDTKDAPHTADISVREYLNDFEEFAAAVNVGLLDKEYVYHIEHARVLNAYFGFKAIIEYWVEEDQKNSSEDIAPSDYYAELRKLADEWKERKLREMEELRCEEERERNRRGVPARL